MEAHLSTIGFFVAPIKEQIVSYIKNAIYNNMAPSLLLTSQGNALLGSQFVLARVLRSSNFEPSINRLCHDVLLINVKDHYYTYQSHEITLSIGAYHIFLTLIFTLLTSLAVIGITRSLK